MTTRDSPTHGQENTHGACAQQCIVGTMYFPTPSPPLSGRIRGILIGHRLTDVYICTDVLHATLVLRSNEESCVCVSNLVCIID